MSDKRAGNEMRRVLQQLEKEKQENPRTYLFEKLLPHYATFRINVLNICLECQFHSLSSYLCSHRTILDKKVVAILDECVLAVFEIVGSIRYSYY